MSGNNDNGNGRGPGRPPAFIQNPEILTTIVDCVRRGLTDRRAAEIAGIHPSTLSEWKGREGEEYDGFREATVRARAEGVKANVGIIERAAEKDWKAAAWLLTHQHQDEFSEKRRLDLEHSGNVGKATPEEARAEALELLRDPEVRGALERNRLRRGALPSG